MFLFFSSLQHDVVRCCVFDNFIATLRRTKMRWELHTLCGDDDDDDNHNSRAHLICISIQISLCDGGSDARTFAFCIIRRELHCVQLCSIWLHSNMEKNNRFMNVHVHNVWQIVNLFSPRQLKTSHSLERHILHATVETPSRHPTDVQNQKYPEIKSRRRRQKEREHQNGQTNIHSKTQCRIFTQKSVYDLLINSTRETCRLQAVFFLALHRYYLHRTNCDYYHHRWNRQTNMSHKKDAHLDTQS